MSWFDDQGREREVDATILPARDGLGVVMNPLVHALDSRIPVDGFEV